MNLLILSLIIGSISVVFAIQNVFSVTVSFLFWDITASLSLIVLISVLVGLLIAVLLIVPRNIKNAFTISRLKKENKKMKKEFDLLKEKEEKIVKVVTPVEDKVLK